MTVCRELGIHPNAYMGWPLPVTYRQHLTYLRWAKDQMGVPSRSDYYAMQVALTVQRQWMSAPSEIGLEDFRINFVDKPPVKELTAEEIAARGRMSEAIWLGAFGVSLSEVEHLKPGESIQFDVRKKPAGVTAA